MCDQRSQIDCQRFLFYTLKKASHVDGRAAAVAGNQCGHAHANEVLRSRQVVNRFDVRMDVDEPGSDDLAFSIDCFHGLGWMDSAQTRNAAILNTYVRTKPGITAAVDNTSVCDQQI